MNTDPNPYAPPLSQEAHRADVMPEGVPLRELPIASLKKVPWTMALYPSAVRLTPSDGSTGRTLDFRAFIAETRLNHFLAQPQLLIPKPAPATVLVLTPEALAALRSWLTPALREHMASTLGQQRAIALLLGVLWILPASRGVEPLPIAFGVAWIAWAAAATFTPHRALFLVNAALWTGAAISIGVGVVHGTTSKFLLLFLVLFWPMLVMRLRSFRFYGPHG